MSWYNVTPTVDLESDDELRARLLDLVDGDRNREEIRRASSAQLEEIASRYNLKRRPR